MNISCIKVIYGIACNINNYNSVKRQAPLKKLSHKGIKIKNKPWLNAEILTMIKIRNKEFHSEKRHPNENCKRLYNLLRNGISEDLKNKK